MNPPHIANRPSQLAAQLNAQFVNRHREITGLLVAILARQNVLLLGPPGTAKSALVNAMTSCFDTTTGTFSWLMTRFTTPEEVFGPISLAALQQDRVKRITTGKLPEAQIAFLDEVFKANSAILNSLLTLINERVFHNDGQAQRCPLMLLVGASNELPQEDSLEALFDRFGLRYWTKYLQDPADLQTMLTRSTGPSSFNKVPISVLETWQQETDNVFVSTAMVDKLINVRLKAAEAGHIISDRKLCQSIQLLKAHAYLHQRKEVEDDDFEILADAWWREPDQRPNLFNIIGQVTCPATFRLVEIVDTARESMASLGPIDRSSQVALSQWRSKASDIFQQLEEMATTIKELAIQPDNPKRQKALDTLASLQTEVRNRVSQSFNL